MKFSKSVFSLLLVPFGTIAVDAVHRESNKAILKFSTAINTTGFTNLAEKDRARANAFIQPLQDKDHNVKRGSVIAANAAMYYTAEIGVGTPPTFYKLLIDTGSSNTWVGASKQYVRTSSSVSTGGIVCVVYGSGAFTGEEWTDTVVLASDLMIPHQSIGVANWTADISGFDGILGLGPVGLTLGTVSNGLEVPTVTNNLFSQKTIPEEVLGVLFTPVSESSNNGQLMFGGYDESAITGPVNYVPLTATFPSSRFWGIEQSIAYGGTTILSSTSGIVDTGTTLILIATHAFQQYKSLTGATLDSTTGLLAITPSQYANLQMLSFSIGGSSYDLIPNAQIWPRSLNHAIGGNSSSIYLVVTDIGVPDGLAFDFINGYTFLERFYSIFDTTNQRFGIAKTSYTTSTSN